ncbi:XrtA/PEP-CTERM system TPR-repeat protein PrsT [Dechloromonas denitrificans]|uniref:XrtA/PEP-CTERM system TPR-repeat protein PrsT n=1 Tax=Dechloromonas denitrificans TaxID=281362 RepID=UPI001CF8B83E|nr:XrtA/PEP-CTERM system TPR-repeat protein PrsT [Dechloromonas denitrificans]UCV05539.1 PEP-CTERM system TPR-repeat protein PrsT [Dechloromonas denitrificans]
MKKRQSIISTAISTALLAAFLGGCGGDSPDALIASGKDFLAKKDSKAAVIQLKNALQKNPELGEARFLLGKALLESGDMAGAEVELRKALDLKYASDQSIPLLAQALLATGKAKKVTDEFAKVELPASEAQANLKTTLSIAYSAQGDRPTAQNALDAALAAKPDYAPAQLADARNKAGSRKFDEAQTIVDGVLAKNPNSDEALLLSGSLQAVKGNQEAAIALYRKAIEARPDSLQAHSAVISSLFQQQKLDDAVKQIDALKKVAPKHPQTLYLDAQAKYQLKDYKAVRELTQQLLKIAPNNPASLQLAGAVEFQLGSYIQAETYLTKALQLSPALPLARRLLVASYLRAGQPAKALGAIQPALESTEKDPGLLALAGETYLQNGDANKAAEYFATASTLDPEDSAKKTSLALAHLAQGKSVGAFEELEQISLTDKGTTADLALIAAYLRTNQADKALKAIGSLEKKQPNNAATYNLRARTLLTKKDIPGARQNFEKALSINPKFFPAAASLAAMDIMEKKPDDARKRFESVLAADPKNIQAMLALAELRASSGGTPDEVTGLISKAIAANPEEAAPRLALIQYHLSRKDNKKALTAASDALAALPDKPEILDALGRTQQATGDLNQALITYGKLAAMQPASPLAQMRLAEIHLGSKNKDEAAKSLKKALEIKPDLIEAQRGLILFAMDSKKFSDAINIARQVQQQRPKEAAGFVFEGDIRATEKAWPEAIGAYRAGLKQVAAPELAVKLHTALLASNAVAEAEKMATTWIKEHPKDVALRVHMGDIATARKLYPQAVQNYRGALEIQPNNPLVLNNLAWVSGQLKAPKALEYAEKANQLSPNQPSFMDTLAMLLADKGETVKAIDLLRKAMAINPQATEIQLNLAKVLIRAGKKDEARKELDAITKLGEKFSGHAEVSQLQKEL